MGLFTDFGGARESIVSASFVEPTLFALTGIFIGNVAVTATLLITFLFARRCTDTRTSVGIAGVLDCFRSASQPSLQITSGQCDGYVRKSDALFSVKDRRKRVTRIFLDWWVCRRTARTG